MELLDPFVVRTLPDLTPEEYVAQFREPDFGRNLDPRSLSRTLFETRENGAPVVPEIELPNPKLVGIAGAGLMGISIAAAFVEAGIPVVCRDPVQEALKSAPERLERELAARRAFRGEPDSSADVSRARELFNATSELRDLASAEVVVETIPEKIKLKAKFYRELAALAPSPLLTLTNSSSLRVSELAEALSPEPDAPISRARFCAFHFFHPVARRPLVEVAPGAETSSETLARAAALARRIGSTPIVAGDGPGLLVNRLLQAELNRALKALDEGAPAARIESVFSRLGFEAPPLRVIDEIGCDVALRSGWSFLKAFPERTHVSEKLAELVREGRLGRKTGRGFYRHASPVPWASGSFLDDEFSANFAPDPKADADLARSVFAALLDEAKRVLDEGIARTYREIDSALVLALGFPRRLGGICYRALAVGELP